MNFKKEIVIKEFNKLRAITWVRFVFFIGVPFFLIYIVKPEWLGRVIAYISLSLIVIVILIRELLRTDYNHVTVFDQKTKKIVVMVTKILGFLGLLLLSYGSINYGRDILFLIQNKKPIEASGIVTEYRATAYSGFGLLGQFLDIKLAEEERDRSFTLVFHPVIKKGNNIRFYYLPNSELIVQVLDN